MKKDSRHIIEAELKEICPLLTEGQLLMPFEVPEGYFEALATSIIDYISREAVFPSVSESPFQVPDGYFEDLSGQIMARVRALGDAEEELRVRTPLLTSVSKKVPYTVPEAYFNTFTVPVPAEAQKGKLVTFRLARKWMQYAAVAMVAGVLVTGAFLFTDKNDYLGQEKYEQLDLPTALNSVSDEELVNYLDNPEHYISAAHEGNSLTGEEVYSDVKNTIQLLSDEEMHSYLNENPEPAYTISHFKR